MTREIWTDLSEQKGMIWEHFYKIILKNVW